MQQMVDGRDEVMPTTYRGVIVMTPAVCACNRELETVFQHRIQIVMALETLVNLL
jgi:hypothetical protein